MTDTPYNTPPLGLFGKRCRILTGYDKRPFVYRIVNSEWMSNAWCEPPITYQSERNPVRHDHSENVLIVVLDTLIDENSRLIRVALKDVELMDEVTDNAGWISVKDGMPPEKETIFAKFKGTDQWNPAMFATSSEDVRVVVRFEDGTRRVWHDNTMDGKWKCERDNVYPKRTVIYWMPNPEPPKEET